MKTSAFLLLLLAVCMPSEGFSQVVIRAPAGTGGLSAAWEWAIKQSAPRAAEVIAVVWTIDSAGANWRWDNQGPPLYELLELPAASGARTAIVAIAKRGEVTKLSIQDLDWPLRQGVSHVIFLGEASQAESFDLVSELDLRSTDVQRARLHVAAIHHNVPAAGTMILEALGSQNRDVRKVAAYAWAHFGGKDALPRLTDLAVGDTDVAVAKAAAYAIGSVDDTASVEALVGVLDDSTRREVRKAAAYALGNLGSPEARAVLIRLIRTEQ